MNGSFASERDILDVVALHYAAQPGAEVFGEIPVAGYGVADLAVRFRHLRRLIVIEGKAGDGWEVYWQAQRWAGRCSESYTAVPWTPKRTERELGIAAVVTEAYEHVKIGRLEVLRNGSISTAIQARRFESFIDCGLDAACIPERLWTPEKGAGLPGAPRWTESTPILDALVRLVGDFAERKPRFYIERLGKEFPGSATLIKRVVDEAKTGRFERIVVIPRPGYVLLAPSANSAAA